ncbi:P-loop containing nucleoside triphosphate hydrolase protein [Xylariomycetidae sp. FL2044]|nr:P-loop containing nucleoside triphosphate hydrolase protein [Xylariomycetidae sp. FL2044]
MEHITFGSNDWGQAPFRFQTDFAQVRGGDRDRGVGASGDEAPEWIVNLSRLAGAGYFQLTLVVVSFLLVLRHLLRQSYTGITRPEGHASTISFPVELCSQLLRAAALAFMTVEAARHGGRWSDVAALAYAFLLGLLRLANDLEWRHVALHHINFVLFGSLLVVAAGDLLPYISVTYDRRLGPMLICSIATLAAAVFVAFATRREWVPPSVDLSFSERTPREPSPEETCSWLEYYVTYEWLTPLMLRGVRRQMTVEELPRLPWYDEPLLLLSRVNWARRKAGKTLWTVLTFARKDLVTMACWVAFSFIVDLVSPFAMYNLLRYLGDTDGSVYRPWVWLILLFVGPLSRSVSFQQYIFTSTRFVVRIKAALTQELYYKAMNSMELDDDAFAEIAATGKEKQAPQKQQATSVGRLANLMSSDIDAITNARDLILITFGLPAGSIVALVGLYKIMDWPALVGVAFMVLLSPVPVLIGQRMVKVQRDLRKIQDARISVISEYLTSIRAIKYFAWEDAIIKKVNEIRVGEQRKIWRLDVLHIALSSLIDLIPTISLLLIYTLHVLVRKQQLTADVAFTSMALLRGLRRNLAMASSMSRSITAAGVSLRRLDRYFESVIPLTRHPAGPLQITNATFRRHRNAAFTLKDITIDFVQGGLNVVMGPSGSGKSTLLLAILGETMLEDGLVRCPEDIAYASQTPWLQNESIRENILFHAAFEPARYDRVLDACGLPTDLDEFPERDGTEVGENGASLSGGQKSRVALARALYSHAPVLLLDDVFSALDSKTSALLWREAFCGDLLRDRTVVLVAQQPWIAPQADLCVTLENGAVVGVRRNVNVARKDVAVDEVLVDRSQLDATVETAAAAAAPSTAGVTTESNGRMAASSNGTTGTHVQLKSAADKRRDEVTQEALKTGPTARLQLFQYMRFFGHPAYGVLALLISTVSIAWFMGTGLWVAVWVDAYGREDAYSVAFYLGIYVVWALVDSLWDGFTKLTYENGGWYAARTLHNTFMRAVLSVPLSWYKTTPVGRIVNRFSRDMASVDTTLPGMLQACIESLIRLLFQIVAVGSVLPIFMLPAAVCCAAGVVAGELYTRTAVAVKRLASSAQSPVFAQFADSLSGLSVIRARGGMPATFAAHLADKLRVQERTSEVLFNCNRWVALKVDMVATLITVAAGAIAVSQAGVVPAGIVGFSLQNATTLSQLILMLVRTMNQLEIELQSFHRIREYADVEPEEKPDDYKDPDAYSDNPDAAVVPKNWPGSGQVEFRDVTIKYDLDGPEILKNINLKFAAGERVAVVGRTGSGKSTLVLSLLRFTNIVSGQILYDGVDITSMPRRKLREALTIIPQEAVLFNGDVGSNLDPTNEVPKGMVEKALKYCSGIASFQYRHDNEPGHANGHSEPGLQQANGISELLPPPASDAPYSDSEESPNGSGISLSTAVKPNGENFSHGQRQVLSLCRALVRKSKLMLLDEATASMDYETDRGIQEVLRKELNEHGRDRTLVTIAHRLKTIIDYDRVVVMSAGSVLEVGSPKELYDAKGQFYDMMKHSGEFEDLERFLVSLE